MLIEVPIVYAENFKEVEKASEAGVEIEAQEFIAPSFFIIPSECFIRINPSTDSRTTLIIEGKGIHESYTIDLSYELALIRFKEMLK